MFNCRFLKNIAIPWVSCIKKAPVYRGLVGDMFILQKHIRFLADGEGLAAADLAKFADANRHTAVCLFAAVRTPSRGFSSHPMSTRENKKRPKWGIFYSWRMGRDSNPRKSCPFSGFQDRRIRPLCHPSETVTFHGALCTVRWQYSLMRPNWQVFSLIHPTNFTTQFL